MAGNNPVQALNRGLAIMELLAAAPDGLALPQLAGALSLAPTTVHNLVRTLTLRGYVRKQTHPLRYLPGPALAALGTQAASQAAQVQAAAALRQAAAALPAWTVVLAQADGPEVRVRWRMSPTQPGVLEQPAQQVMPPYTSATALALQAYWPPEQVAAYRHQYPFGEYGLIAWHSEAALDTFLAQARTVGQVRLPRRPEQRPLLRLAVPLLTAQHEVLGALGASIPAASLVAENRLARAALTALRAAAATLRASPAPTHPRSLAP